jgi:hypothetical protein
MERPTAIFLIHLIQDVQVLRPLIFMAAHDFGLKARLLVSDRFRGRDVSGIWSKELEDISTQSGADLIFFSDEWEGRRQLNGHGVIFSASESNIRNHSTAHDIFRVAPSQFLRVTVQHGFECVGLRHGVGHKRAYGQTASFAADVICTWYGIDHLASLSSSQAPKVLVCGPTSLLQSPVGDPPAGERSGLVCENLHSVRFESTDKLEAEFLKTFRKFAGAMNRQGRKVRLRPHPGGRHSAKSQGLLPKNVEIEDSPMYRLDLRQFAYGVSPPSSVLIDMLLANIPTAVWRDWRGRIDLTNYEGLTVVSSSDELIRFVQAAEQSRDRIVLDQRRWLDRQGIPLEPTNVHERYSELFEAALRMNSGPPSVLRVG